MIIVLSEARALRRTSAMTGGAEKSVHLESSPTALGGKCEKCLTNQVRETINATNQALRMEEKLALFKPFFEK